jgi:hypothetical protein
MYATWIEHSLNLILQQVAFAQGLSKAHFQSMIKEASLRAKTTWILPLLGVRPLTEVTVGRVQKLADTRNAFIHYKWGQLSKAAEADQQRALADAEKVVRTIQRLRRQEANILSARSRVIRSLLKP